MFGKIKALALYGGTDRESYSGIKNRIEESNRKTALVFGAESKMYKDKAEYYSRHDRRAR